jgi:hypothetical protein
MAKYYFLRESRTPSSESYRVEDRDSNAVGRVDVHFAESGCTDQLAVLLGRVGQGQD